MVHRALQHPSRFPCWTPVCRCPSTASHGSSTSLSRPRWTWHPPRGVSGSPYRSRSATGPSRCTWLRPTGFLSEISAPTAWSRKFKCTPMWRWRPQRETSATPGSLCSTSASVQRSPVKIIHYILELYYSVWLFLCLICHQVIFIVFFRQMMFFQR